MPGSLIYFSQYPQEDVPVSAANPLPVTGSTTVVPSGGGAAQPVSGTNPLPMTSTTNVPTYTATVTNFAVPGGGVILSLRGSGTRTIRIRRISLSGIMSTAAVGDIIVRRYSALSGGTSTNPAALPLDSQNAAATGLVDLYTVVPTTATIVGGSRISKYFANTATGATQNLDLTFGANDQAMVLRGTSEWMGIFFATFAAYTGAGFDFMIEWTEE